MKTILITGCSSGIGYATARYLKGKGYRVFATCRKQKDVNRLQKQGFESFLLDVSSSESINKAVKEIKKRTESLYALFNNAGIVIPGAIEDFSRKTIKLQFEINIFGAIELTNAIIPLFRKNNKGRIIFTSSILGLISTPYKGLYAASKYAMEGFVDSLRLETPKGIHVTLIEPGPIHTNIRENALINFKKYIDRKNSVHKENYKKLKVRDLENKKISFFKLPAIKVAMKVHYILEHPNPKPRYYLTIPTHVVGIIKRILPSKMIDKIILKFN